MTQNTLSLLHSYRFLRLWAPCRQEVWIFQLSQILRIVMPTFFNGDSISSLIKIFKPPSHLPIANFFPWLVQFYSFVNYPYFSPTRRSWQFSGRKNQKHENLNIQTDAARPAMAPPRGPPSSFPPLPRAPAAGESWQFQLLKLAGDKS